MKQTKHKQQATYQTYQYFSPFDNFKKGKFIIERFESKAIITNKDMKATIKAYNKKIRHH
jgi:hypothetical protein